MADMIRVSATEFVKEVGRYQDVALIRPVVVTGNGRDQTVMISADEYQRLKRRDLRVVSIEDFTDEDMALIAKSEVPPGYEHLDAELKTGNRELAASATRPRYPVFVSLGV